MDLTLPDASIPLRDVDRALLDAGFTRVVDQARQGPSRAAEYVRGDARVLLVVYGEMGAAALHLNDLDPELRARLGSALRLDDVDAVMSRLDAATDDPSRLAALRRVAVVANTPSAPDAPRAVEALARCFESPSVVLRAAAASFAPLGSRAVEAALANARQRFRDLDVAWERARELCQAAEEGTLGDLPTDDARELERRAVEGAQRGQWTRVQRAADAWLATQPWVADAWFLRGRAEAEAGDRALGYLWIVAACDRKRIDLDAEVDVQRADGVPQQPERVRALEDALAAWERARDAVRATVTPGDAPAGLDELLLRWAEMEGAHGGSGAHGLAAAGRELPWIAPSEGPFARWLRAEYDDATDEDRAGLLRDAPESAWVWAREAEHAPRGEYDARRRAYAEAQRWMEAAPAEGTLAARIAALQTARGASVGVARLREGAMRAAYEAQRWDEAAALADAMVEADPDAVLAWQTRANARTFGLRHEEAAAAYDDALRELDRIVAGGSSFVTDPRSSMEFNRACVLAKLGRRDDALDGLRRAIAYDEKWAGEARADDYFEALWSDPEFLAVVRGDPGARRTRAQRSPEYGRALLIAVNGDMARGDARAAVANATEALSLAEALDAPQLAVTAGLLLGYARVAVGELDAGLEVARRARARLDAIADAPAQWRAEQLAEFVTPLTLAGRFDEAERASRDALSARVDAFGERSTAVLIGHHQLLGILAARGAPEPEQLAVLDRALSLARVVVRESPDEAEPRAQRAQLLARRATLTAEPGEVATLLDEAVGELERALPLGGLRAAHVDMVLDVTERAASTAAGEAGERLVASHARALAILYPGPAEREERLFWRRMRRDAQALRMQGVDDARIASMLSDALRGEGASEGAFDGFGDHIARAAAGHPTLMVLAPMSIETATLSGDVMRTFDDLEDMILGGGDEDYDDEDEDGER
ncbi:MAG: hypothetical protein R3A52_23470 [Polyangiales bacterium]